MKNHEVNTDFQVLCEETILTFIDIDKLVFCLTQEAKL